MDLADALRLDHTSRIALVGAGGKTSALFAAANALKQRKPGGAPVILTTSTHLAIEQCDQADIHRKIQSAEEIASNPTSLIPGINLFTGTQVKEGRIIGPDPDALQAIYDLAEASNLPLLIEADGSRMHPLKAPAEHEPVIPPWINHVLVCAGLSGLGKPLDQATVHRPEIYAQLASLGPGEPITPEAIVKVLANPLGGLKGIPPSARRSALLNQADTPQKQAVARRMAEQLLSSFESVIISSFDPPEELPTIHARIEPTAGIILAAGSATRFGRPKQLAVWEEETLIHRVCRIALLAGLDPVIVVTGAYAELVEAAILDLPVQCIFNSDWDAGQGTSVATGIRALPEKVGAAIFLLSDQPGISPGLLSSLKEVHAVSGDPIIGPLFDGQRGNPVLFDRITFKDLSQLQGEQGGRAIFSHHKVHWIPWQNASAGIDIDTPLDLERLNH